MSAPPAQRRRDILVGRACLGCAVLQAVPPVLIAWGGYGAGAAADAALIALSSPVLLGVVAFGVVVGLALDSPGLEPRSDQLHGPVDERGARPVDERPDVARPPWPVQSGAPSGTVGARVRWSAIATLVELAVLAAAVVVDGGLRAGAESFLAALDDGSAVWTFVLLVVQSGFIDARAPVAFAVAWVVLARAQRPLRPVAG
ncbi:hypothetical protein [Terrabacter terrigena]|uniref:Uncharacterized protein n=1 Tax=Terrabacter terrigena TaxID=574718 RepID=A0ABW3MY76_9MICO